MNKLSVILMFALLPLLSVGQSSFKLKVDISSPVSSFTRLYKVAECADGGFAIAGVMNYNGSWASNAYVITKFDTSGLVEWSKIIDQVQDFNSSTLIATADSGFYLLVHAYDFMFALYTYPSLFKFDKYGNVQHAVNFGPDANGIRIDAVEKYSEILHISGGHYQYDPITDDPCCYSGYVLKLNPDLTVNSHDSSRVGNFIIYDSLQVPQLVKPLPPYFDNSVFALGVYDTTGIVIQSMEYFHDSSIFTLFNINNILQHGGNYYYIGVLKTPLNSFISIQKLESNWNTVYFKILDGTNQFINPGQMWPCKSSITSSGNIHIAALANSSGSIYHSLMVETDTAGNVNFAILGNNTSYFDFNTGSVSDNFYFMHRDNNASNNFMPVIEKTNSLSPTCDFVPLTFTPLNVIITDSLFTGTNMVSTIMVYPTVTPGTPTLINMPPLVLTDVCSTTSLEFIYPSCEILTSPNPSNSFFKVTSCDQLGFQSIDLINLFGDVLHSYNFSKDALEYIISTENLPAGSYFIAGKLLNGKSFYKKIIVAGK